MTQDDQKRAGAEAAVAEVQAGMRVGLGTGSTAAFAVAALARRGLRVETVVTSERTRALAEAAGLVVRDFADLSHVDVAIDGADEVDPRLRAIKGAGGAMLREKVVAEAAARFLCVVDASKRVARLGAAAVPLEVLPFAGGLVAARVRELGADVAERAGYRTDQGNVVLDAHFGPIDDPEALAAALSAIPGMLGHGLFPGQIDTLYVGADDGVARIDRG